MVMFTVDEDTRTRRVYMSLHSAVRALERAEERGLTAKLMLCALVPVGGDAS
ncbi:hypothetical protein [Solicola sp. PLA-1-18]|uniref:hypothetical protein n=1 Tax=Solicola sp. PLA-1-18 TaxID=3380532 RepID=UPI003B7B84BD